MDSTPLEHWNVRSDRYHINLNENGPKEIL